MKVNTTIGLIGTGGIATALAKGFCSSQDFNGKVILYSPNINTEKKNILLSFNPDQIFFAKSNQDLINEAEVIFPAVLPNNLKQVVEPLNFRKENKIIHIAAGIKLSTATKWYFSADTILRAVPLPFASMHMGPVVLFKKDDICEKVLSLIGSLVNVKTERELEILAAITGMMVPYYATVSETIKWGITKGIAFDSVLKYTTLMNEALSVLMRKECPEDINSFLVKNTTPNGMNELGLRLTKENGVYMSWFNALESIGKHYNL